MEVPSAEEAAEDQGAGVIGEPSHILPTWQLFALLVCATLALSWYQRHFIMTREVYHQLLGGRLDTERIDLHFDVLQQTAKWGYLAVPVVVGLRLGVVSLLIQLFALLSLKELRLSLLFRAVCWAYPALLYGMLIRTAFLGRIGADDIEVPDLSFVPGSVSAFLLDSSEYSSWTYRLLNYINLTEVLWCVALYFALSHVGRLGRLVRVELVLAVWGTTTLFQWSTTMFLVATN